MFKRRKDLTVLVATTTPGVLPALLEAAQHLQRVALVRREALSASGAYAHLSGAHLAIIDPATLAGADAERAQLTAALQGARQLVVVSGADFLEEPSQYLERAVQSSGLGEMLPPRAVAFTALSGGVGKTTLALATARAFHAATRLPAVVIELSPGPSALYALAQIEAPTLYEVLEQGAAFPTWEGVTLAGMDWSLARLLEPVRVANLWTELTGAHIFTACDAPAWHPLFKFMLSVSHYLVLSDGRVDALGAAVTLHAELARREVPVEIALNRAGVAGRVSLPLKPALQLPALRDPWQAGTLVLKAIYPGVGSR
jgi:hypothetical protein